MRFLVDECAEPSVALHEIGHDGISVFEESGGVES